MQTPRPYAPEEEPRNEEWGADEVSYKAEAFLLESVPA